MFLGSRPGNRGRSPASSLIAQTQANEEASQLAEEDRLRRVWHLSLHLLCGPWLAVPFPCAGVQRAPVMAPALARGTAKAL